MGAIGRARIVNELQWEHHKEHLLRAYEALFRDPSLLPGHNIVAKETKYAKVSVAVCQEVESSDRTAPHLSQLAHEEAFSRWKE